MINDKVINIAIFASGTGSNAQKIIDRFRYSERIRVALIVCNNPAAGVLKIAAIENIPVVLLEKATFQKTGYISELKEYSIDFVILAGFLWKIPPVLISAFPDKIINIHPALLLSPPVADREAAFDWYGRRFAMVETEPCSVQSALSAIAASTRAARRAGT